MSAKRRHNRRDALILALARGLTIAGAARVSGYSQRQAQRLLDDPAFRSAVASVRSGMVSEAVGLLAATNAKACRTLRALLSDPSSTIRLAAAKAILDVGQRLRDANELEQRLEAIECRLGSSGKS
jgi:hypothetical protein